MAKGAGAIIRGVVGGLRRRVRSSTSAEKPLQASTWKKKKKRTRNSLMSCDTGELTSLVSEIMMWLRTFRDCGPR